MKTKEINAMLDNWIKELRADEKSENTIKNYSNAVRKFINYLESNGLTDFDKSTVAAYKQSMIDAKDAGQIKTTTINSRITGLNKFLSANGMADYKVRFVRQQHSTSLDDMLTESDFNRLINWADILTDPTKYNKTHNRKKPVKRIDCDMVKMIMLTLAGTGIRISELEFFTYENLFKKRNKDKITVKNKNKERDIIIPDNLRKELRAYAKRHNITSGLLFPSSSDPSKLIDKAWIYRKMKYIAGQARVSLKRVHAHSFRHLFAKRYMSLPDADLLTLADLLGHSSLETTRIYTRLTSKEQKQIVNKLFDPASQKSK